MQNISLIFFLVHFVEHLKKQANTYEADLLERKTRSGASFSPFSKDPIKPHKPFFVEKVLRDVLSQEDAQSDDEIDAVLEQNEQDGSTSSKKRKVEDSPEPSGFRDELQGSSKDERKKRKKAKYRQNRLAARVDAQEASGSLLKGITVKKRNLSAAQSISVPLDLSQQKPSKGGFKGLPDRKEDLNEYELHELVSHELKLIEWNGR